MAKLHYIAPQGTQPNSLTVRLGTSTADNYTPLEQGKFVKLVGESAYGLCAEGDEIEGYIDSVSTATSGGWSVGGIIADGDNDIIWATADGLQASAGTGTIAIGDYVVTGTVVAKGTQLTGYPRVVKATNAPNTLINHWRVMSLGTAGTGAVGTTIAIRRVN